MELKIENITLRRWRMSDVDDLQVNANNYRIAENLRDGFPNPYGITDGEAFISGVMDEKPLKVFAIEINGEACGAIGIFVQDDIYRMNAEIGYWLAEKHWNKGIMTRLIRFIVNYGFETWELERIFAKPFSTNVASQKALEKAGMKLEARLPRWVFKNGEFRDELIYAILKSEHSPS